MTRVAQTSLANTNRAAGAPPLSPLVGASPRRAALVGALVGCVLTALNQPAAVFGPAEIGILALAQVTATPFFVVILSQILATRRGIADLRAAGGRNAFKESLLVTAVSHGIPARALGVGVVVASLNTAIALVDLTIDGNGLSALPMTPLAQAWVLPVLFGMASQAISYRRVRLAPRP